MKVYIHKNKHRYIQWIAVLVCLATLLDISYLNILISNLRVFKIAFYVFVLVLELIIFIRRKLYFNLQMILLLLAGCVMVTSTLINNSSFINAASILAPIVLVFLLLANCYNQKEIHCVLKIWCTMLFCVVMLDFLSILIFPKGLYRSAFYSRNWVLGYKTNRLTYSFPLLVFYNYLTIREKGSINLKCYLLAGIVGLDALLSRATAGSAAVVIYSVLVFILFALDKDKRRVKYLDFMMKLFSKPSYYIPFYLFLTVLIIILQNQSILQNIAYLFDKTDTLGERTVIWERILNNLNGHWILGRGAITSADYMQITGFVVNAHNVVLTYLINGGLLGSTLLACVVVMTAKRKNTLGDYVLLIYVFVNLCVGITSAILAFCPYFFGILLLPRSFAMNNRNKDNSII